MTRRNFLALCGGSAAGFSLAASRCTRDAPKKLRSNPNAQSNSRSSNSAGDAVTLFLCGGVMTGRGIDQILPHSGDARLYESFIVDAKDYVAIAERVSGPIPDNASFNYVWGDALAELSRVGPDARIVNLETAVTTHDEPTPKGIHYRMHPDNVPVLTAAGIDCCVLGNNHSLDWGRGGLVETLEALEQADLRPVGAGRSRAQARSPVIMNLGAERGRLLIFSLCTPTSGVPARWEATKARPGVFFLPEASRATARDLAPRIREQRREGDIVVVSIHWGGNWGYDIPRNHADFAHTLIDEAGVHVVHGHSSHHARAVEVHNGALILYGCGDFLNDYEGISGHEAYRSDLPLMYFVRLDRRGTLTGLNMTPMHIRRFQLVHASPDDTQWLQSTLDRECQRFGTTVSLDDQQRLQLSW